MIRYSTTNTLEIVLEHVYKSSSWC